MHKTAGLISDSSVTAIADKHTIKYTFGANYQNFRLFHKLYCL